MLGWVIGGTVAVLLIAGTSRKGKATTSSSSFDLGFLGVDDKLRGGLSIDPSGDLSGLRGEAARSRARQTAASLEARYGIVGLADFLDAVAHGETGGTYAAGVHGDLQSKVGHSIGLYQMKTTTAYKSSDGYKHMQGTRRGEYLLEQPDVATILAANHAVQAIERARSSGTNRPCAGSGPGDWLSVRRWWKYPSRVHDWCESEAGSVKTRERFEHALEKVDLPRSFMYQSPDVSGWPGLRSVLREYGISLEGNV